MDFDAQGGMAIGSRRNIMVLQCCSIETGKAHRGDACHVVTDEVGKGHDAAHLHETDETLMHRGHDLWLATLKWVSECK
jgi:hypothetical protein